MANQDHIQLLLQGGEPLTRAFLFSQSFDLSGANLVGKKLPDVSLYRPNMEGAKLRGADLTRAHLAGANLKGTDFEAAQLRGATFTGADFTKANLTNADLVAADFTNANLYQANLAEARLQNSTGERANLSEAYCPSVQFTGAKLSHATLHCTYLYRADLTAAVLSGANLHGANLREANLTKAKLNDADLSLATLVGSIVEGADLTNSSIYGIAAWDIRLDADTQQNRLRLTRPEDPAITVDDLEVAQFIYLLLNRDKLRKVLNAVTERGVLILGRFGGGGLEVLQAIAAKLKEEKYIPILFDFEGPSSRNYTETIKTLVGLARFVIVDLSGPSVPQELYATVPHFKVPFVPILEAGRNAYSMVMDILEYPWVLKPPVFFTSTEELIALLPEKIIVPAEEKHKERQTLLRQLFNR